MEMNFVEIRKKGIEALNNALCSLLTYNLKNLIDSTFLSTFSLF